MVCESSIRSRCNSRSRSTASLLLVRSNRDTRFTAATTAYMTTILMNRTLSSCISKLTPGSAVRLSVAYTAATIVTPTKLSAKEVNTTANMAEGCVVQNEECVRESAGDPQARREHHRVHGAEGKGPVPCHVPICFYAVVYVAVQRQQRYGDQCVDDIGGLLEGDSIVMLSQPGDYEEPSHPYRNPQAVAEVVRIGPVKRPSCPSKSIAWHDHHKSEVLDSSSVRRSAASTRFAYTIPYRYNCTAPQEYKRTLRSHPTKRDHKMDCCRAFLWGRVRNGRHWES